MVRQKINKIAFYRFRYPMAYTVFAVALASMLIIAGFYLPGGLTQSEIDSALISDDLSPAQLFSLKPDELIYLPYRLLQAASISLFGISLIGIKLPSIILGFLSALGILYLLNLWYRRNVAIIAALVAVTTNQFLLASQAGVAGVAYIFLTTMTLIAASMIARKSAYAKSWILAGAALAGISMYMPLNVYMLLALGLTALIHPHARHLLFKKSAKPIVGFASILFAVIISPLIIGVINDPGVLRTLLGIPKDFSNIGGTAQDLLHNYIQFHSPATSEVITPVYGLTVVLLLLLGVYRLISAKYTTKSYILSFWLVLLVPLVCLNPSFVSITFVPVVLLIALAIEYLIRSWYRLFPRNPYARVFGLIPLAVLVVGLVISNVDRYVYGLHYERTVYASYDFDLPLLSKKLRSLKDDKTVVLVVEDKRRPFYESFARHQDMIEKLSVTSDPSAVASSPVAIVAGSMKSQVEKLPSEIVVMRTAEDADRFYLYKNR